MKGTGRALSGPGARLVEVTSEQDLKHTIVVFDPAYRDHACLNGDLEAGMGFMENPDVTGLCRLVGRDPEVGAFVYPTGTVWSLAELMRELSSLGQAGGIKAALELCFLTGEILVEAADKAIHSGLYGHGSLDPWRIFLKADGQVSIIGYGLPKPGIEVFLEDEARLPSEDALRYCAPESLGDEPFSDISSDLFSLTLVALELMVGRPVYNGLGKDIRQQAARGEAIRRLYQWREKIPEPVREVLGKALKPDPDVRYRDGLDFVYSVHDLLGGIDAGEGPSLRELVTRVRARQKRGKAVVGGNTGALTMAELAELAADIDQVGVATELPEPRKPRPDEVVEDDDGDKPRWRRATRGAPKEEAPPPRSRRGRGRAEEPALEGAETSARGRLLKRLRNRDEPGAAPRRRRRPAPDTAAEGAEARPRRRGRRPGRDTDSDAPAEAAPRRRKKPPLMADDDSEEITQVQAPAAKPEVRQLTKPAPDEKLAPEPPPEPAPEVSTTAGRRRRSGGRAAALLERLRSSSGGHTTRSRPPAKEPSASLPKPAAPPLAPQPEVAEGDDELEAVMLSPEAAGDSASQREIPAPVEEDIEATVVATVQKRPTPPISVEVSFSGRSVSVEPGLAYAVCQRAVEALELSTTDLLGTPSATFRLVDGDNPLPSDARVEGKARLDRVLNSPRMVLVEVAGKPPTRVRTLLGEGVPVRLLKGGLRQLLGLKGSFDLSIEGETLGDDALLADWVGEGELVIQVVK